MLAYSITTAHESMWGCLPKYYLSQYQVNNLGRYTCSPTFQPWTRKISDHGLTIHLFHLLYSVVIFFQYNFSAISILTPIYSSS